MQNLRSVLLLTLGLTSCATLATGTATTKTGIPLDAPWKVSLHEFAEKNVRHSIWGMAHSERNYQVAVTLAAEEGLPVDKDVLFAAAFLHDIGAIEPFRIPGVEHATRSVQIMEPLLKSYGVSGDKIAKVRETILGHMYNTEAPPKIAEATLFHDADTLDFLGSIGLVRIAGLTDRHGWAPTLPGAIETLHEFMREIPDTLFSRSAKAMAVTRSAELKGILDSLKPYTFDGLAL